MSRPSPTQIDVLERLSASETRRLRWTHRGWTLAEIAERQRNPRAVPEWTASAQTIKTMEQRGWLQRSHRSRDEQRDDRELTQAGLDLIRAAKR